MPVRLSLSGFMKAPTATAVRTLEAAFAEAHAFVTEAHLLGGLALVFHWEMETDHRAELEAALRAATLHLDARSRAALHARWAGPIEGSLHVTLEHEGPDEKVVVPGVPG